MTAKKPSNDFYEYDDPEQGEIQPGFDVVCTIGRVTFGDGPETPYQAAFNLIGQHGAPGVFSFSARDETPVTVEVIWG